MRWLVTITILILFSSCNYETPKQSKSLDSLSSKKQTEQYSDQEIDSVINVNKDNKLFLDFYYGMDTLMYSLVSSRLKNNGLLEGNGKFHFFYQNGDKLQYFDVIPNFSDCKLIRITLVEDYFKIHNNPIRYKKKGKVDLMYISPPYSDGLYGEKRILELNLILKQLSLKLGNYQKDNHNKLSDIMGRRYMGSMSGVGGCSITTLEDNQFFFNNRNRLIRITSEEYKCTLLLNDELSGLSHIQLSKSKKNLPKKKSSFKIIRESNLKIIFEKGSLESYYYNREEFFKNEKLKEQRIKDSIRLLKRKQLEKSLENI